MIDVAAWGGAQWVLVTLFAMGLLMPWGYSNNSGREFAIEWMGTVIWQAIFSAILAWGGFWA